MSNLKKFHIGALVSISSGRALTEDGFHEIYPLMEHIIGFNLWNHFTPEATDKCRELLINQHPWLLNIVVPKTHECWSDYVNELSRTYGEYFEVTGVNQAP